VGSNIDSLDYWFGLIGAVGTRAATLLAAAWVATAIAVGVAALVPTIPISPNQ